MELHVELNKWDDAFLLLKSHPEFADVVYLPYAKDLALKVTGTVHTREMATPCGRRTP
jgi:hypothetical protein